jgi:hypothetical protein
LAGPPGQQETLFTEYLLEPTNTLVEIRALAEPGLNVEIDATVLLMDEDCSASLAHLSVDPAMTPFPRPGFREACLVDEVEGLITGGDHRPTP